MKDWNSPVNQAIKRRFIDQEVSGCFTREVEYILSHHDNREAPFSYEDIENLVHPYCADCGRGYTCFSEKKTDNDETIQVCANCGREYTADEFEDLDVEEEDEILEWWAVSHFLARKLAAHGHCIIEGSHVSYWGRPTTGQEILLDEVISDICAELGILDGQINSWCALINPSSI